MARSKSEDKRSAILAAAMQVFAERGLDSAPTSAISRMAGVAEGTLFIYFKTKDDLLNALYREIKLELADAILSGFPRKKSVRIKMQHLWDGYVNWGISNPQQRKALSQLQVSDRLTQESREAGYAPFAEIHSMASDAIERHVLREIPLEFISAMMGAMAEITMAFIATHPDDADGYRVSGFEMFWKGIAKR